MIVRTMIKLLEAVLSEIRKPDLSVSQHVHLSSHLSRLSNAQQSSVAAGFHYVRLISLLPARISASRKRAMPSDASLALLLQYGAPTPDRDQSWQALDPLEEQESPLSPLLGCQAFPSTGRACHLTKALQHAHTLSTQEVISAWHCRPNRAHSVRGGPHVSWTLSLKCIKCAHPSLLNSGTMSEVAEKACTHLAVVAPASDSEDLKHTGKHLLLTVLMMEACAFSACSSCSHTSMRCRGRERSSLPSLKDIPICLVAS